MYLIVLAMIFASIFILSFQFLSESKERAIRARLIPGETRERGKGSPFRRLVGIFTPTGRFLGSRAARENISGTLVSAGSSLAADEFFALKGLSAIVFAVLYLIVGSLLGEVKLLWLLLLAGVGFIVPNLWLRHKLTARHRSIAIALPEVIDLLHLCVGAGLDFMMAIDRVIERMRPGPLREELHQVRREIKVGESRRDALRAMSKRVDMPELGSFVRTLVQADRMGAGIGDALRIQSEEMRSWRFEKGEREALRAPIKMLIPLIFCILPSVLIIVGGPLAMQFMKKGALF